MNEPKKSKTMAYIPNDAKINLKNENMEAPVVKYEKRRAILSREQIKEKITKKNIL